MLGIPASVTSIVLSSGAALVVDTHSVIQASVSPGSDTLKNITNTNTNAKDILALIAKSGDTITVSHNDSGTGNIFLLGAVNKTLSETVPMLLFRVGSNWYEFNLSTSIVNAEISGSAAIAYGKLNLSGSIVNADINSSAAIAASKINGTAAVLNVNNVFTAGLTMSGADITLAGNKIATSNFNISDVSNVDHFLGGHGIQIVGSTTNQASVLALMPNGTSVRSSFQVNRVSDTTNWETLFIGSDLNGGNEFDIITYNAGTGTLRPIKVWMKTTLLMSFDTANTITASVPLIISGASLKPQYTSTGTTGQYAHDYSGGSILTVNNNATATPISTDSIAFLFMIVSTGTGAVAFGQCSVGRNSISLFTGSDGLYTTTSGSASKVNLYITSSTFTIENKSGSNDSFRIVVMKLQ